MMMMKVRGVEDGVEAYPRQTSKTKNNKD